jgi:Protein of unknown function (DUF3089)
MILGTTHGNAARALVFLIFGACQARAQAAPPPLASAVAAANDYSKAEAWLCRPGRSDACSVDLGATIVAADGTLKNEDFRADPDAAIDCFYLYPTVSLDETPNSDMTPGPEERNVVKKQFARFGAVCRLYAPLYRQMTLPELGRALRGQSHGGDERLSYGDVLDAWHYYLEHDNHGRGVVLVGHSQGAGMLTRLLTEELDGKPRQALLVSAVLAGADVAVPEGRDVGATFHSIPLCHDASQTGCLIAFSSFRATSPPGEDAIRARSPGPGLVSACVNPANLKGGEGELKAYLSAHGAGLTLAPGPWVKDGPEITRAFVEVPGLLSASCVSDVHGSYLAVSVHGDPKDPRTDDIAGDVVTNGKVRPRWGLHAIDVDLTIGNLVEIVGAQAKAWSTANDKRPKGRP